MNTDIATVIRPIERTVLRHWRLEYGRIDTAGRLSSAAPDDEIALLSVDAADQSTNVISRAIVEEFDQLLNQLSARRVRGLIIRSTKPSGFFAGADVHEFGNITDAHEAAELARQGQGMLDRLAALPYPSVALIHGICLGGGLELALACTYRVARDDGGTRLGLPEVMLGIHPGFAGTLRLPALIGHVPALELMMTGRTVSAREARKLGLVDDVVAPHHALYAAQHFLLQRPAPRKPAWYHRVLGVTPARPLVARLLTRQLRARAAPHHYPAPYRIIDLWKNRASAATEAMSLGELLVGRTSRNLVHVFELGEELKRRGRQHEHNIRAVHVIGAGVMGADIAMWAALRGFRVTLQDQKPEILARAISRAHTFFERRLKAPHLIRDAMDRLMPDIAGHGIRRADLIIEAIVEKVEPKSQLLRHVEQTARRDAVIATNTSSIPLETLAQSLRDPSRLVGLHFFNPVARMQLVEIVRGEQTAESVLNRARGWTVAIDRLPLDVRSSPGFLVNRVLTPYLLEAVKLLEEGISGPVIDRAAVEFGMPMGPIELADTVGLDICLSVAESLAGPLGIPVPSQLREFVEQGRLGKKSGHGFYRYDAKGRPRKGWRAAREKPPAHVPITERLVLRLLNEAAACLREGVVEDADAVDAGMVYGTGFAPYLGGPMRYAESLGATGIGHSLLRLSQEYGERFIPDPIWSQPDALLSRVVRSR